MAKIRILSHGDAPFRDRREAGRRLATELGARRKDQPIVLGIPRGGVVVAAEIAAALPAELDIVLVRKLGSPSNPELAIGAVGEDGHLFLDERLTAMLRVPPGYVDEQLRRQRDEIARRVTLYRAVRPKIPLAGRTVILTDDGLATGATMQAALWAVRHEKPARIVVAVPVGAPDTVERIAAGADDVLCLQAPEDFGAVGRFFRNFEQVSDEEVLALLRGAGAPRGKQ